MPWPGPLIPSTVGFGHELAGWGLFPWGDGTDPGFGRGPSNPVVRPSRLGTLSHVVVGQSGAVNIDVFGELQIADAAPGGCQDLSAKLDLARQTQYPAALSFPATWRVVHRESGAPVWGGDFLDPSPTRGMLQVGGRGWSYLAAKQADRLLIGSSYLGDWASADSAPYNYATDTTIQANAGGSRGALQFVVSGGSTVHNGDQAGLVLWAQNNSLTRVAFTVTGNFTNFVMRVFTAVGPSGSFTQRGADITGPGDVDLSFLGNSTDDLIEIRLTQNAGADTHPPTNVVFTLTNVRVNAWGFDDSTVTSDVVGFIGGLLGVDISQVAASSDPATPFDVQQGSYAEALDRMALLSDWRWLLLDNGFGPFLDFGPWNKRVWIVADPELPQQLVALDRYNVVVVPFSFAGDQATGNVRIRAQPDPFPNRDVIYPNLAQMTPATTSAQAELIGQYAANYLSTLRYGGTFTVSEVVDFFSGARVSALLVGAGDSVWFPSLGRFSRIQATTKTPMGVTVTLATGYPALDTYLARIHRRMAAGGTLQV